MGPISGSDARALYGGIKGSSWLIYVSEAKLYILARYVKYRGKICPNTKTTTLIFIMKTQARTPAKCNTQKIASGFMETATAV